MKTTPMYKEFDDYKTGELLIITSTLNLTEWLEIGDIVIYGFGSLEHVYVNFKTYLLAIKRDQCELLSLYRTRTISEIINS